MIENAVEWIRALWTLRTIQLHALFKMFLYLCEFDDSIFGKI